ncbi:PUA-like domain-containing protein [Lactifluus volemus]|nr:PUA-like domain-containing protein [Lactifluus volemus]
MPSHLLSLLYCPLCPPQSLLVAPITLFCGHSLCCNASPIDPLSPPNIPSSSRITFYPPVGPHLDRASTAIETIPDSRTDVTINKLSSIIHRYEHTERPSILYSGSDSDSQTDEEILNTHPSPAGPSTDEPSSESSIPPQISSDASQQDSVRPGARKRRRKQFPPPRRLDAPAQSADLFKKELFNELTCEICLMLLYQPITSPCQHTFCTKCLYRSLDHGNQCPLCRHDLPGFSYFQDHPFNKTIFSIILKAFPEAYAERGRVIEQEERHARLDTPIFVSQLSFPGLPTDLHFHEPRYRLMLRRCLEKKSFPCFGMIMPQSTAGGRSPGNEFGTMLEIRKVRMQPDGSSRVETWGIYRFRIMERGTMDGYMVARIECISDYPSLYPVIPDNLSSILPPVPQVSNCEADLQTLLNPASIVTIPSTSSDAELVSSCAQEVQELVDVCHAFLNQIQRGAAPWVLQRLNRFTQIHGPMPDDPTSVSYWMAMVLPIEDMEKAKLLPVKSPLLRLRLVVHWIEQLNRNWWFTNGCIIT